MHAFVWRLGTTILSVAVSFFVGALVLSCVMALGVFGGIGHGFRGLQNAPPWAFLGGALGTTFVLGSIIAIPQAGSVIVICSAIVGQMIGSYLIDTFGCLGVDKVPFSWLRLSGIGFLLLGVFWYSANDLSLYQISGCLAIAAQTKRQGDHH